MPDYTFECTQCSEQTVLFFKMSEYTNKSKKIRCPFCKGKLIRDFATDNVKGIIASSASESKTIGQYAEKQTAKYGKQKVDDMMAEAKTKKTGGMHQLPTGMKRMDKPNENIKWTKD